MPKIMLTALQLATFPVIELTPDQVATVLASYEAPSLPAETYPRDKVIEGVAFHLASPINPKWRPGQASLVIGGRFTGANMIVLADPALPRGARSPAGYPMFGSRVSFQDQTFANDADVEQYITLTARTPEQVAVGNAGMEQNMREVAGQSNQPAGDVDISGV